MRSLGFLIMDVRRMRRRTLMLASAVVLALGLVAGGAYGYWHAAGSGSSTVTLGAMQSVTVVAASGTPASNLVPGGTADLVVTVNNANSVPVNIVGIGQGTGSVSVVGGTGCTTTGVSVPSRTGLSLAVAAGNNVTVHIPNGAAMSTSSDSGCQGASFQIPVTLTVQR